MKLSVIIPTRNRDQRLQKTLAGLAAQVAAPEEVIVVDGSDRFQKDRANPGFDRFLVVQAERLGAAAQRNQAMSLATGDLIGFCDDDIDFEAGCLRALREFLAAEALFGGVSATIINQSPPGYGWATRTVLCLIDLRRGLAPDGRIIGPGLNFLPRLESSRTRPWQVEWLNTTCTLYRRAALPMPPFDRIFTGYSMLEDVTLSVQVGRDWKLAVLPKARVFHDSQPSDFKRDFSAMTEMELRNRRHLVREVLGRRGWGPELELAVWFAFGLCAAARQGEWSQIYARILGYRRACRPSASK